MTRSESFRVTGPAIDRAFVAERVVLPDGIRRAAILVKGGTIVDIVAPHERPLDVDTVDVVDAALMPGVVDSHVHINEPGRTAWEGFATATEAAARGGITTLVDMPLNALPPTVSVDALAQKLDAASHQLAVDVAFWGGVVPENASSHELVRLVKAGVRGFKCFLIDSGVPEFGFVTAEHLRAALPVLKDLGVPLLAHAELQGPCDDAAAVAAAVDPRSYRAHLLSRPNASEDEAVKMMVALARSTRAHVHIVHHASASSIGTLRDAHDQGIRISAETCPHYLTFAAEDIPDGATHFKCTPPIRDRANNEGLWQAVKEGVLSQVVSDHSPCTAALKKRDVGTFTDAWGGIAGLQVSLPASWTGMRTRGMTLLQLVERMCTAPAKLAGLTHKGALQKGMDADIVAFDPDAHFVAHGDALAHKNKLTPYDNLELFGVVRATWLRGQNVCQRGHTAVLRHGRTLLG